MTCAYALIVQALAPGTKILNSAPCQTSLLLSLPDFNRVLMHDKLCVPLRPPGASRAVTAATAARDSRAFEARAAGSVSSRALSEGISVGLVVVRISHWGDQFSKDLAPGLTTCLPSLHPSGISR